MNGVIPVAECASDLNDPPPAQPLICGKKSQGGFFLSHAALTAKERRIWTISAYSDSEKMSYEFVVEAYAKKFGPPSFKAGSGCAVSKEELGVLREYRTSYRSRCAVWERDGVRLDVVFVLPGGASDSAIRVTLTDLDLQRDGRSRQAPARAAIGPVSKPAPGSPPLQKLGWAVDAPRGLVLTTERIYDSESHWMWQCRRHVMINAGKGPEPFTDSAHLKVRSFKRSSSPVDFKPTFACDGGARSRVVSGRHHRFPSLSYACDQSGANKIDVVQVFEIFLNRSAGEADPDTIQLLYMRNTASSDEKLIAALGAPAFRLPCIEEFSKLKASLKPADSFPRGKR